MLIKIVDSQLYCYRATFEYRLGLVFCQAILDWLTSCICLEQNEQTQLTFLSPLLILTALHILQTLIKHTVSKDMQRRPWTPHQDQVLKNLYQKVKLNKWSLIARRMEEQYSLPPRTGKQCRQRYNNHLNPSFAKEDWTEQEEKELLRLHNELGNKWAIIAARLGGRTDNGVKNHFFAKLRKSMRRINKIIQERFKKKLKELKLNVLYKIVEASEQKFKKTPLCSEETSKNSCMLKNKILAFSLNTPQEVANEEFAELINQINDFSKSYKRKPKQLRRVPDQNKSLDFASYGQNNQDSEEQKSIFEKDDSQDQIIRPDEKFEPLLEQPKMDQPEIKMNLRSKSFKGMNNEGEAKPQTQAQRMLDSLMIEQDQNSLMPPLPPMLVKRGTSSEFIVDSSRNEHQFCTSIDNIVEQSGAHNKLPSPLAFTPLMKKESCDEQLFRLCRD